MSGASGSTPLITLPVCGSAGRHLVGVVLGDRLQVDALNGDADGGGVVFPAAVGYSIGGAVGRLLAVNQIVFELAVGVVVEGAVWH